MVHWSDASDRPSAWHRENVQELKIIVSSLQVCSACMPADYFHSHHIARPLSTPHSSLVHMETHMQLTKRHYSGCQQLQLLAAADACSVALYIHNQSWNSLCACIHSLFSFLLTANKLRHMHIVHNACHHASSIATMLTAEAEFQFSSGFAPWPSHHSYARGLLA